MPLTTHIVDQDRENIYKVQQNTVFFAEANYMENQFFGLNLHMDKNFLGTFDTPLEIINEIKEIFCSTSDVHVVSGYCEAI